MPFAKPVGSGHLNSLPSPSSLQTPFCSGLMSASDAGMVPPNFERESSRNLTFGMPAPAESGMEPDISVLERSRAVRLGRLMRGGRVPSTFVRLKDIALRLASVKHEGGMVPSRSSVRVKSSSSRVAGQRVAGQALARVTQIPGGTVPWRFVSAASKRSSLRMLMAAGMVPEMRVPEITIFSIRLLKHDAGMVPERSGLTETSISVSAGPAQKLAGRVPERRSPRRISSR
mmetsp:Transcript_38809/g.124588  ORF Transcript_38809/g.124588 Transcript_38809/m.124588 type:complete len:230 (-) Transcript_38809:479-1168(-)